MKWMFFFRSCIARRILRADGLLVVMQIFSMPCANSASASLSLAVQMPMAPAAICSFAMAAHLCVLACGRVAMPFRVSVACIFAMFCSILSRSTQSAGVSRSHFEMPTSMAPAGGLQHHREQPGSHLGRRIALDAAWNPHRRGARCGCGQKRAP